jgi:hypothetical protein
MAMRNNSALLICSMRDTSDQWFGQRQEAEALSSGSISDFAENGFVR